MLSVRFDRNISNNGGIDHGVGPGWRPGSSLFRAHLTVFASRRNIVFNGWGMPDEGRSVWSERRSDCRADRRRRRGGTGRRGRRWGRRAWEQAARIRRGRSLASYRRPSPFTRHLRACPAGEEAWIAIGPVPHPTLGGGVIVVSSGGDQWGSVHPDGEGGDVQMPVIMAGVASMGLRPSGRRRQARRELPYPVYARLQWGSVHPDGEGETCNRLQAALCCSNWAASIRTEKASSHQLDQSSLTQLQWGSVHPDGEGCRPRRWSGRGPCGLQWGSVHPDGEGGSADRAGD